MCHALTLPRRLQGQTPRYDANGKNKKWKFASRGENVLKWTEQKSAIASHAKHSFRCERKQIRWDCHRIAGRCFVFPFFFINLLRHLASSTHLVRGVTLYVKQEWKRLAADYATDFPSIYCNCLPPTGTPVRWHSCTIRWENYDTHTHVWDGADSIDRIKPEPIIIEIIILFGCYAKAK